MNNYNLDINDIERIEKRQFYETLIESALVTSTFLILILI